MSLYGPSERTPQNMNLPNKLTIIRFFMIPLCMACILFPIGEGDILWRLLAAAVFGIASLTDYAYLRSVRTS